MTRTTPDELTGPTLPSEKSLAGMLALMVADREERIAGGAPRGSDIVLSDAGFSYSEIGLLTGRGYEAVKSAVRRHRASRKAA